MYYSEWGNTICENTDFFLEFRYVVSLFSVQVEAIKFYFKKKEEINMHAAVIHHMWRFITGICSTPTNGRITDEVLEDNC